MKTLMIAALMTTTAGSGSGRPCDCEQHLSVRCPITYIELAEVHAKYIDDRAIRVSVQKIITACIDELTAHREEFVPLNPSVTIQRAVIALVHLERDDTPHVSTVIDLMCQALWYAENE